MEKLLVLIFLPFFFSFLLLFLPRRLNWGYLSFPLALSEFILCLFLDEGVFSISWSPALGISFSFIVDGLSIFFSLIVTGIGSLIFLYSIFYIKERFNKFHSYMLLFMGSMLGTVFSSDLILLFVFWEIMSLSCFLLIAFPGGDEAKASALQSLLITMLGGIFMLAGFIVLGIYGGSFDISRLREIYGFPLHLSLTLILIGAFTKSAQFPFHTWLPKAMVAPVPVSAYLHAAAMVKAGVFIPLRFYHIFSHSFLFEPLLVSVGLLTFIFGSLLALLSLDVKKLLAYSTLSKLGLIFFLIGLGGISGALLFILAHSIFKAGLFMVAGLVEHSCGTRDIRKLGGLSKKMPISSISTLIFILSMGGVPFFSGFWGKEVGLELSIHNPYILPLFLIGCSLTFSYSLKLFHSVFLGEGREAHREERGLILPLPILVALTLMLGLSPGIFSPLLQKIAPIHVAVPKPDFKLLICLLILLAGSVIYFPLRNMWKYREIKIKPLFQLIYDLTIKALNDGTAFMFSRFQSGYLRHYIFWISLFFISTSLVFLLRVKLPDISLQGVEPYEYLLFFLFIASSTAVILAKERLSAIISLGVIGSLVIATWVIYSAPDLALTQILMEVAFLILFSLVFRHSLPFTEKSTSKAWKIISGLIAGALGSILTLTIIISIHNPIYPSIKSFFFERSMEAGGRNVVNLIIVDFRGYDTMGEITVLSVAILAILFIYLRRRR